MTDDSNYELPNYVKLKYSDATYCDGTSWRHYASWPLMVNNGFVQEGESFRARKSQACRPNQYNM